MLWALHDGHGSARLPSVLTGRIDKATARHAGGRSGYVIRKVDSRGAGPPERKLRWWGWLLEFLQDHPDATVEDYLEWCRSRFSRIIIGQCKRKEKWLVGNRYFQAWIDDHRRRLDVDPEVVKRMSGQELAQWDGAIEFTAPDFRQQLVLECMQLSLSPAWMGFIESMILFDEGSAGYPFLSDILGWSLNTDLHVLTIKVRVESYLTSKETGRRMWGKVKLAKSILFGREVPRLHDLDFEELDRRDLFLVLVEFDGYTGTQVAQMLANYRESDIIHESIRQVYPDVPEEKLTEFLEELVAEALTYDDIHTIAKNYAARLGLEPSDKSPGGAWSLAWGIDFE